MVKRIERAPDGERRKWDRPRQCWSCSHHPDQSVGAEPHGFRRQPKGGHVLVCDDVLVCPNSSCQELALQTLRHGRAL